MYDGDTDSPAQGEQRVKADERSAALEELAAQLGGLVTGQVGGRGRRGARYRRSERPAERRDPGLLDLAFCAEVLKAGLLAPEEARLIVDQQ